MISLTSPIETPFHRISASVKLGTVCGLTLLVFLAQNLLLQLALLLAVLVLYLSCGRQFAVAGYRSLRLIVPIVILIFVWHVLTGTLLVGLDVATRLAGLIGLANFVTMTTRLDDLLELLHRCLWPVRQFGVDTYPAEVAVALVIRFTPELVCLGAQLSEAWRARSTRYPGWRIIVPLVVRALDDADQVGEALRARGGLSR